jgi:DNA-binding transcriptional MerR regulator/methylmalonyl-CoA mutase cobalamin-binding subunit
MLSKYMSAPHHGIKAVVHRTGLSAHVIRIWEKRYGAVKPERTGTNRRLYSDEQVERLRLLRQITQSGHNIGLVAKLPTAKLREVAEHSSATAVEDGGQKASVTGAAAYLQESIAAVHVLDARALQETLDRAETELGGQGLLQRVVAPLAQAIGDLWRDGSISAAHEHFASAVIRIFLGHAAKPFAAQAQAPSLVVATPSGQLHELGALLVGAAAANLGWHVTYLGASLPAAEIAGAARQNQSRAVALSVVYPEDDPRMAGELSRLRELLPKETAVLVGGRAMPSYRDAVEAIGALPIADLGQFCSSLDALRRPTRRARR